MKPRIARLALCVSLVIPISSARGVSLWELATHTRPETAREALILADAEMVLYDLRARTLPPSAAVERLMLDRLAHAYERVLAIDPQSALALGTLARIEERRGRYDRAHFERACALAQRAVELSPRGPEAPGTLFTLALAHTRLERFDEARDAYLRQLEFTLDDEERAVVYGNLGDTYVSLDDLPRAIDAYRTAVSIEPTAMGWLGLAVTLDRDGRDDFAAAADRAVLAANQSHHARRASLHLVMPATDDPWSLTHEIASPNVFFVPAHDRHYYDALALEAVARSISATQPTTADEARQRAASAWELYLRLAPATDRWRARAEGHLRGLRPPTRRETVRRAVLP